MTDLEITGRCAVVLHLNHSIGGEDDDSNPLVWVGPRKNGEEYRPLHDAAQAMALEDWLITSKRCLLVFLPLSVIGRVRVSCTAVGGPCFDEEISGTAAARRRFICECVAKIQTENRLGQRLEALDLATESPPRAEAAERNENAANVRNERLGRDAALFTQAIALLHEWQDTELDQQDEEFEPWLKSFTQRIDAIDAAMKEKP